MTWIKNLYIQRYNSYVMYVRRKKVTSAILMQVQSEEKIKFEHFTCYLTMFRSEMVYTGYVMIVHLFYQPRQCGWAELQYSLTG